MTSDLRQRLYEAEDRAGLLASVRGLGMDTLGGRESESIARRLRELAVPADLRLLLLGNHTLDPLARTVSAAALCRGIVLDARVGPFDQHMQMLIDPALGLAAYYPQAIFLSLDLERLLPALPAGLANLATAARRRLVDQALQTVTDWVELARAKTAATLLVGTFWRPRRAHLGLADAKLEGGEAALYGLLNARLLDCYAADPRVYVVDVDHAVATVGRDAASDPRMKFLAKLAWAEAALPAIADLLARYVGGLVLPPKKCLVLDLDNTLWGGVLGEEGPDGIRIAEGDPVGEAFRAFQTAIKVVQQRGLLLAACSKNNPGDVEETFRLRPDMPLQLADFTARRINWEPKHQNIQAIAAELNVGTDSLVFVDDNPAECELIRQMLPEVEVVQLPKDPTRYAGLLLDLPSLERLEIAAEDRRKTEQYQEQAEREAERVNLGGDMRAYLASLETEVKIWPATRAELTRAHQLFAKTNQFNLTTKRYKPADIEGFLASADWRLEVVSAKDRFGDLGIIAAILLERQADGLVLDSLVMSCRAMGRGIETVIANRIKAIGRAERPGGRLFGVFRSTAKNTPAADFFEHQGFDLVSTDDAGNRRYSLDIAAAADLPMLEITVDVSGDTPQNGGVRALESETG